MGWQGTSRLGLVGTVDQDSFNRLCDNLHPQTGEQLTVRKRSERRVGYDFTFSVPKSVSLLYAMSGDQDIMGAFRSAVDETMRETESEMKTRVRQNRQDTTGNGQYGLGGIHPYHVAARGWSARSPTSRPCFHIQCDLGRRRTPMEGWPVRGIEA